VWDPKAIPDWSVLQPFQALFRSVSSVLISGEVLAFPIPAITRDVGDHGDLAPPPSQSSQIGVHLRGVHPRSSQIGVCMSNVPTVWRRVGIVWHSRPRLWAFMGLVSPADCQLLFARC
jgi:hypothetical protein